MYRFKQWWRWLMVLAALQGVYGLILRAQTSLPTTTVQDTVYRADGTTAGGSVVVSWSAFTTAGGRAVPAGSTSAAIGPGGIVTMSLAPNAGSTPMGSYYTAIFHLNDGTTSREYWVVPVQVLGGGPAKLGAIRNQVLPASVAMQTVSKQYVDSQIAAAQLGVTMDASPYVQKAGDTMTGPLVLPADPVSPNQAADKNYVDSNVAAVAAGLGQKVSLLPSGTQVVSQPSGTQLQVNLLNGELFASQFVSGAGGNGIANAAASADCANGCVIRAEPTYTAESANPNLFRDGTLLLDERGGAATAIAVNPMAPNTTLSSAETVTQISTMTSQQLEALHPGALGIGSTALTLQAQAVAGGNNLFPEHIEQPPYFKSTYGTLTMRGNYNTQGQHVQMGNEVNCFAVGDCIAGGTYVLSSGGYRDEADEGAHPFDIAVSEDLRVFTGTCTSGCATGATTLVVTAAAGGGTQGDGRFLIDTNPAKVLTTGTITGGGKNVLAVANFSGTNFAASTLFQTAQAATSQPANIAPGTVIVPVATTNLPAGFVSNTAALPANSGVACIADGDDPHFEMAPYRVVDATHIQLTLNKPHASGAVLAAGGLCGYGLEQKADTVNGLRQVFPVVGSINATSLYYADAQVSIVGNQSTGSTSAFLNISVPVASATRSGGTVTLTTAGNVPADVNGLTLTVSGVTDSSYNGSFTVQQTAPNSITYAAAGSDSTSSGGTISFLNGAFALYPMAEVLNVANPATRQVDGTMTLAPNLVAWAAGDTVEQPHYYKQSTYADTTSVAQFLPRTPNFASAGIAYNGLNGVGIRGWQIFNQTATNNYLGGGGTHQVPSIGYQLLGAWNNDIEVDAGLNAVMRVHCSYLTCTRFDSSYRLFDLDAAVGEDLETYSPNTSTVTWTLRGSGYSFAPDAFRAGTIDVGTLNANTINVGTTIMNGVSGAAITSGVIGADRLPVFGASGSTHSTGAVPDPGTTAGSTRYLREDGTWTVPGSASAGGGAGSFTTLSSSATATGSVLLGGATAATSDAATVVAGSAQRTFEIQGTGNSGARASFLFSTYQSGARSSLFEYGTDLSLSGSKNFYIYDYAQGYIPLFFSGTGKFVGINSIAPAHTLDVAGDIAASVKMTTPALVFSGGAPGCTVETGAGSGATCTVTGTNQAHVVTLSTGTATSANAPLVTISYTGSLDAAPVGCTLTPRSADAAAQSATVYTTAPSVSAYGLRAGTTALPASNAGLSWYASCF